MHLHDNRRSVFLYYFLAFFGSLSSAGANFTLIALSASLFSSDHEGIASSYLYLLNYLGIGLIGFIGGWILQRFTAIELGVVGSLFCAVIVLYLGLQEFVSPTLGLTIAFIIFLINGIDHPNNLRFFNEVIPENEKIKFFSLKESVVYCLGLFAPILAAIIIKFWGVQICFILDSITYMLSAIPWLFLKKRKKFCSSNQKPEWFVGFKLLIKNENIC